MNVEYRRPAEFYLYFSENQAGNTLRTHIEINPSQGRLNHYFITTRAVFRHLGAPSRPPRHVQLQVNVVAAVMRA